VAGAVTARLRSARWEDAEAVSDLFNRIARVQYGTDDSTAEEVRRFWRSPRVRLEDDVVVAEAGDGTLVGYGDNFVEGDDANRIWMDVRGEPASELIRDLERRGSQRAVGKPLFFRVYVPEVAADTRRALEAAGYRVIRESFRMVVDLADEPPAPEWPEGVSVRPYRGDADEPRVFEAQEETFSDMWEYAPQPIDEWREWMLGDRHDPALWFLAEAGGELVGICLCRTHETADPDMGWVSVLGVRRPWRRRGLGLALLQHTFREFRVRGRQRVGLGVDGESETGAVELYRRAGMDVSRRSETWERRP
jgi:mycothiol synthase